MPPPLEAGPAGPGFIASRPPRSIGTERNWGDGYFFSRNVRDLASELAARFAEFQPIFYKLGSYISLEETLAKYQGNIPAYVPPDPPVIKQR